MSNLSPERKKYVTGSQAHRVMAGFEDELKLAGRKWERFSRWDSFVSFASDFMDEFEKAPLVRDAKAGGFELTGAEIKEACAFIKASKPIFTAGMESYAQEIAMHSLITGREEGYEGADMQRGNELEQDAVNEFCKTHGASFEFTGEDQAFVHLNCLGLTPDGLKYDDMFMIEQGLEVKCPKQTIHMKNLCTLRSQNDLLKNYPEYYWQCMTGLAVTTASVWHWASYNETFQDEHKVCHVPVERVPEHVDLLISRSEAVTGRAKLILKEITA